MLKVYKISLKTWHGTMWSFQQALSGFTPSVTASEIFSVPEDISGTSVTPFRANLSQIIKKISFSSFTVADGVHPESACCRRRWNQVFGWRHCTLHKCNTVEFVDIPARALPHFRKILLSPWPPKWTLLNWYIYISSNDGPL